MNFNNFVYYYCILTAAVVAVLYFLSQKLQKTVGRFRSSFGQENAEFRSFQQRFMSGYLPCLFADSLQAPYLYYLYQSYGFLESQIAVLYICGYSTSICVSLLSVYLVQRVDRRLLCLLFVALTSVSCLMKFVDVYIVLLFSRMIDGVASSLLVTPFQEWYVHEHVVTHDFPKEWIASTFRRVALANGVLSVAAGFVAELSESTFRVTAFPFLLAIPVLLMGGFLMSSTWSENRLSSVERVPFVSQAGRALRVIVREPNVFLLSAVQSLFEACIFMFVFFWTPVFLQPLLAMRPSVSHRLLSRRFSAPQLLCVAAGLATLSMCTASWCLYPVPTATTTTSAADSALHLSARRETAQLHYALILAVFGMYQFSVGLYFPVMQRLHKDVLTPAVADEHTRSAVLAVFRIPLNVIASAGLLVILHGNSGNMDRQDDGNWMMVVLCAGLLAVCLLVCVLLARALSRYDPAHLPQLQMALTTQVNEDTDDEVFG